MIKGYKTQGLIVNKNEVKLGTPRTESVRSSLVYCSGSIKEIDNKQHQKTYTIQFFKWALIITIKDCVESATCYHDNDYVLTDGDTKTIQHCIEKWNSHMCKGLLDPSTSRQEAFEKAKKEVENNYKNNDIFKDMLDGANSYQEAVEKAKRKGGWTYRKENIALDRTKLNRAYVNTGTINSEQGDLNSDEVVHYIGCDFCDFEYGVNINTKNVTDKGQFNACSFGEGLRDLMKEHGVDTLEFKKDGYVVVEDMNITIGELMIISDEK